MKLCPSPARYNQRGGVRLMFRIVVALLAAATAGACAKSADKVTAAYVSPLGYDQYNCQQIAQEAERISARVQQAAGAQNKQATSDAVATTVGIVIFWPALFFIGGDDATTYELARLKGEIEAIERASIAKNCGIVFQQAPPEPTAEELQQQQAARRTR